MAQLSNDDLKRVQGYLSASQHQVKRRPFSFWKMALGLGVVLALLTWLSVVIASAGVA